MQRKLELYYLARQITKLVMPTAKGAMRLATFNVQNLRLRGDELTGHFDGARDDIKPLSKLSAAERQLDVEDRRLTAQLIAEADADVIALQEVFNQQSLDVFHQRHLVPLGAEYAVRICMPGNDGRRQVALMSRRPLAGITTHAALTYDDLRLIPPAGQSAASRIFRRDCLVATYGDLFLLVVHFKAPSDALSLEVIRREATAVRMLVERRFPEPKAGRWLILGDVNVSDQAIGDPLASLTANFAIDLGLALPPTDGWTYFDPDSGGYLRPDRMLASPAIADRFQSFAVRREGMSKAACLTHRMKGVGDLRPRASDHAIITAMLDCT